MMISTPTLAIRLCAVFVLFYAMQADPIATAASDPPPRPAKEKTGKPAAAEEPKRIVKVYLVNDLFYTPNDYPFQGSLPTAGPFDNSQSRPSMSQGGGRTGMGVGGMGRMQMRGMGGMGAGQFSGPGPRAAQLIRLITTLVKGEWQLEEGGRDAPDQCMMYGNNLVVRQTEEGHNQIFNLIRALSNSAAHAVTIEATWIWLDAQKRDALRAMRVGSQQNAALDAKQFRDLARDAAAFRGQITCLNGQTVHFATGERRVVSAGATPTVGVGASAYSPKLEMVNIGAVLQATPTVSRERQSAFVDLHSVVTQWGAPGEPIKVTSQNFAGSSDKSAGGTLVQDMATVDRLNLGTQEWSTTAAVPLGVPVLVGSVTFTAPADQTVNPASAKRPELALVIEVRASF
jgi:hypothetical protein